MYRPTLYKFLPSAHILTKCVSLAYRDATADLTRTETYLVQLSLAIPCEDNTSLPDNVLGLAMLVTFCQENMAEVAELFSRAAHINRARHKHRQMFEPTHIISWRRLS